MTVQINPYQPFQVRICHVLTTVQLQILTQLYQPIVGTESLGLYLTLMNQPLEEGAWSYRQMHSRLVLAMNIGIKNIDEARQQLEAVGLIRTYRDKASHANYQRQTLIYDMQVPLSAEGFFEHPYLSTALFYQIGDESYYALIKNWQQEDLDLSHLSEISQPFTAVYSDMNLSVRRQELMEAIEGVRFKESVNPNQELVDLETIDFNFDLYYQILQSDNVDIRTISHGVLEQVATLGHYFQLDEQAMAKVTKLAQNAFTGHIDIGDLRSYAQKYQYFSSRKQGDEPQQAESTQRLEANTQRKEELSKKYPHFTNEELDIVIICEGLEPANFLQQMKESTGGFVTSEEQYYLKDLSQRSKLSDAVLNMLIYYLIVFRRRPTFEKGFSSRTANEWQQQNITDPAQALDYLLAQKQMKEKQTEIRNKQIQQKSSWSKSKTRSRRQETIPSWLKEQSTSEEEQLDQKESLARKEHQSDPQTEEALRQRLRQVLNKDVN